MPLSWVLSRTVMDESPISFSPSLAPLPVSFSRQNFIFSRSHFPSSFSKCDRFLHCSWLYRSPRRQSDRLPSLHWRHRSSRTEIDLLGIHDGPSGYIVCDWTPSRRFPLQCVSGPSIVCSDGPSVTTSYVCGAIAFIVMVISWWLVKETNQKVLRTSQLKAQKKKLLKKTALSMIIDLLSIVVDEEESQSLEKIQKELKAALYCDKK